MLTLPVQTYGGVERIIESLAQGLAERGHEVTVFCAGGSTISGAHISCVEISPYPTSLHPEETQRWEQCLFKEVMQRQREFDVIHFHFEPIVICDENGVNLLDFFTTPVVCTFHNITTIPKHQVYYRETPSLYRHTMVFISENQRNHVPFFPHAEVIYNAIPVEKFSYEERKENYLLFLGRITPVKGILQAIKVARQTNTPLMIAARIDASDQVFYEHDVKPLIDGVFIRYVGEADFDQKVTLLKRARALLFPILWEEPFGLVMIEALACGTPVIAFRRGSVPEIMKEGVTGYVVDTIEEMVESVNKIGEISPAACRADVEQRFSQKTMIESYEAVYRKVVHIDFHEV